MNLSPYQNDETLVVRKIGIVSKIAWKPVAIAKNWRCPYWKKKKNYLMIQWKLLVCHDSCLVNPLSSRMNNSSNKSKLSLYMWLHELTKLYYYLIWSLHGCRLKFWGLQIKHLPKKHLIYRVPIGLNNLLKLMFVFKIVLRGNSFTLVNLNEGILIGTLILV